MEVEPVPMAPFFIFVIATVFSLVLGHVATACQRRAASWDFPAENIMSSDQAWEPLCFHNPRVCYLMPLVVLTGPAIIAGAIVPALQMETSGVLGELILHEDQKINQYSLIGVGMSLARGENSPAGLRIVQGIFFTFTLVIPLLLSVGLSVLLFIPIARQRQIELLQVCCILDAWSAFDVFVLGVAVANFEFGLLSSYLVYNDNIARVCNWVHNHLQMSCIGMDCHVHFPGFFVLVLAGLASYIVPKRVFRFCDQVLKSGFPEEDEQTQSSSDEETWKCE
eukprot:TRINITY_DN17055_c0_g2_i1.p1 TRINITY_DN17055_c0_g2~~TRINITY_DN17055_c0_g2_i1.p1  ORF type:complete len:326 (+),score=25.51 TRINITY_DN17055_c0_g2_i1:139-978(+)